MNEEEFQKQKIEKREKIDTILAYVILGILVFSIVIITYLKFVKKSDAGDEYTVTYATISDVASGLNNSNLGVTAAVTDRAINITKDNFDITVSLINNNELEFKYSKDNKDMVTSIYKEVLKNLCVFYGNSDSECTSTVNAINEESNISGIRFLKDGDNTSVYINILSSISLPDGNKKVYNEETITDVSFNDYELKMSDVEVTNITVNKNDNNTVFIGNIKNLGSSKYSIKIKLYDKDGKIIRETSQEYNTENRFEITFDYNDSLNKDSIVRYSISINR